MLHLRIGLVFSICIFLSACGSNQGVVVSEAEEMQASVAQDVEGKRNSKNFENEASSVASYSLPKVTGYKMVDGKLYANLKISGKCETHKLKWVKKADCVYELRDLTTTDKCMGYQLITEEVKVGRTCEKLTINGMSYP